MNMGVAYRSKAFEKTRFHFHSKNIDLKVFTTFKKVLLQMYKTGLKLKLTYYYYYYYCNYCVDL